jgi:hypothetical protein
LTLFQTWDYNFLWYKSYVDEVDQLFIIGYGSLSNPIFILPCYINLQGRLKLLQTGSSDFLDAVYNHNVEFNVIMKKCFEAIDFDNKIKIVDLINLSAKSPIINYAPFALNKRKCFIYQNTIHTYIPYYLFEENKIHKLIPSKKNGKLNKISKQFNLTTKLFNANNDDFPINHINELLEKMNNAGIRQASSFEKTLDYFQKLYSLKHIFFVIQYENDKVMAASCLVKIKSDELLIWNDYFDPTYKEINLYKYLWLINYCKLNQFTINFGTGVYPYKISNFVPINQSLFSLLYTKSNYHFSKFLIKKLVGKLLKLI